jgi:hypothetical protein
MPFRCSTEPASNEAEILERDRGSRFLCTIWLLRRRRSVLSRLSSALHANKRDRAEEMTRPRPIGRASPTDVSNLACYLHAVHAEKKSMPCHAMRDRAHNELKMMVSSPVNLTIQPCPCGSRRRGRKLEESGVKCRT